jgi:hypothetical protein
MTFFNFVLDESLEKILCSYINTTSENQIIRIKPLHALPWERVVFSGQHLLFEAVLSDQLEIKTSEIVTANIPCYELRVRESLENIREFIASYLEMKGMAWWVEIVTQEPKCIYYFGPFTSSYKAQLSSSGYIEDLEQEEAQVIAVDIKRGQPSELTIFENELGDMLDGKLSLAISNFVEAWLY